MCLVDLIKFQVIICFRIIKGDTNFQIKTMCEEFKVQQQQNEKQK